MSLCTVWRICAARHQATALSGEGARLFGGRWSPPGIRVVYTAENRSLAALEILVHVGPASLLSATPWVVIELSIPKVLIDYPSDFPPHWDAFPFPHTTQDFGRGWAETGDYPVLRVPSAVVPGEFNYLLNPAHPGFAQISVKPPRPFHFDPRLGSAQS